MAILWGEEFHQAWSALPAAIGTAATPFEHVFAEPLFSYLATRPVVAARFNDAMTGIAELLYPQIARALTWSNCHQVIDVGGGNGFLLSTLLSAHKHLRGTLFDLAPVVNQARAISRSADLDSRLSFCAGDFFQGVPAGADCLILSNVLHDWKDTEAREILLNCRRAMLPHCKLVVVEMSLGGAQEPLLARSTDLNMLTLTGGKERTLAQFQALFSSADLRLDDVVNLCDMTTAIVAHTIQALPRI
ncbi:MAG TPA: methyltransferase [Candidatus Angelobacter sp.]|nr:methyltransferase [Candidatus Angelobacter sp.]